MSTVCAGCGGKDGEHADTCRDLDGIRIRLEKRVADLEMKLRLVADLETELMLEKAKIAKLVTARVMDNFLADQLVAAVLDFCMDESYGPLVSWRRDRMIESAKAIQKARIERP
jgi:hypothetical protein